MRKEARLETVSYHQAFYANNDLFQPGSWLHKPAPMIINATEHLDSGNEFKILDLGCGIGRHAIPLAKQFREQGVSIIAVDLLKEALSLLHQNSEKHGVAELITSVSADVEEFDIYPAHYDYILSCSCIEHVSSMESFQRIVQNILHGTAPAGVNCLMTNANVEEYEVESGLQLTPLIECRLKTDWLCSFFKETYASWQIIDFSVNQYSETVQRNGKEVRWSADFVGISAKKPSG